MAGVADRRTPFAATDRGAPDLIATCIVDVRRDTQASDTACALDANMPRGGAIGPMVATGVGSVPCGRDHNG